MIRALGLFIACLGLAVPVHAGIRLGGSSNYIGGNVEIDEPVDGDVHAVAGNIRLDAPVSGNARLAGGNLVIRGAIQRNLKAAGGNVTLDAPVGGDVSVAAGTLRLGPNARIGGELRFRGGTLEQHEAAQVAGGIRHRASREERDHSPFGKARGRWIWTAGLMLLAGILAAALPGPSERMMQSLRAQPWMAPLLGFIVLTAVPVAAVLVMITIIGIPIGLLALLAYAALLLVGYVSAAVVVGGLLLGRVKAEAVSLAAWRAGAAVLMILALALVSRIPFLGGFVQLAALVLGVGLVIGLILRRSEHASAAAA
jgi:hypothetical protein